MQAQSWTVVRAFGASLVLSAGAIAQPLFSQPRADGNGQGYHSNTTTDGALDQRVADDFTLASASHITGVTFWGGEYQRHGYQNVTSIRIEFFADDGILGAPGSSLFAEEFPIAALSPVATGYWVYAPDSGDMRHEAVFTTPFAAAAGVRYWMAISGTTATVNSTDWFWTRVPATNDLLGVHYFVEGEWLLAEFAGDVAFVLVPGPGSGAVVLGAAAWLARRRRDQR